MIDRIDNHLALLLVPAALLVSGCMLQDLREQVSMMDRACRVEGRLEAADGDQGQGVVVAMTGGAPGEGQPPTPVDYIYPDASGDFSFALAPGQYRLLAFADKDGDLELDDDEPVRHQGDGALLDCPAGGRLQPDPIVLEAGDRLVRAQPLSVHGTRSPIEGAMASAASLGQLTAFGEIVPLSDPRFDPERARDSLWRPLDFLRDGNAGVYLAEPLRADRTPVLFIHGINGSPRVLEPLIRSFDEDRFQPMYFYYASGMRIEQVAWHLDRIMRELELRRGVDEYHVVAHSMGGLVARAWLKERAGGAERARILSLVTLSTPWSGYPSARQGVDHSPVVVPVWRDMATGSEFLQGLFDTTAPVCVDPPLHLLFSFRQSGWMPGPSGDGVAALGSMLPPTVQRQAASVFGVDAGHVDILSDPIAQARIRSLLMHSQASTDPDRSQSASRTPTDSGCLSGRD